jgi:hypothetical protein
MALAETLGAVIFGVPLYDWLLITGSAAKIPSFEYHYWPLTNWRIASVAILGVGTFFTFLLVNPPEGDGGLWKLAPAFMAMAIHGGVAISDIFRQRRLYVPPEHSDRYGG